jgi:hypothetical protein
MRQQALGLQAARHARAMWRPIDYPIVLQYLFLAGLEAGGVAQAPVFQ